MLTPAHLSPWGLDQLRLDSFSGGDPGLERVLLELYAQTATGYVDGLERAADRITWQRFAHALKGASGNIGAVRVALLAGEAEAGHPDPILLSKITAELELVRTRLAALG